jgi:hypothetical protein
MIIVPSVLCQRKLDLVETIALPYGASSLRGCTRTTDYLACTKIYIFVSILDARVFAGHDERQTRAALQLQTFVPKRFTHLSSLSAQTIARNLRHEYRTLASNETAEIVARPLA